MKKKKNVNTKWKNKDIDMSVRNVGLKADIFIECIMRGGVILNNHSCINCKNRYQTHHHFASGFVVPMDYCKWYEVVCSEAVLMCRGDRWDVIE